MIHTCELVTLKLMYITCLCSYCPPHDYDPGIAIPIASYARAVTGLNIQKGTADFSCVRIFVFRIVHVPSL